MKTKTLITFFLTCYSILTYSQQQYNIVNFKNGSIVKGQILDSIQSSLYIQTIDGNIFSYKNEDVEKTETQWHKFLNYTSTGLIMGSALNEKPVVLSLLTEFDYQICQYFAFGLVTGGELINEATVPFGFNVKFYIPTYSRMVFFNASIGKSISVEKPQNLQFFQDVKAFGGPFGTLELGMAVPLNYRNSLFFSMGYRYNELEYEYDNWSRGTVERTYYYHRLSMRIGMLIF